MKTKNEKGYSLVEVLLVIGFVMIATTGIYTTYNKAAARQVANQDATLLAQFKRDILTEYESSATYVGISNTTLNNNKITPIKMRNNNVTDIINSYGGTVDVSAITHLLIPGLGFRITTNNVSTISCPTLAVSLGETFDRITINGTVAKTYGSSGTEPDVAASACDSVAGGATILLDSLNSSKIQIASTFVASAATTDVVFDQRVSDIVDLICDFDHPEYNNAAMATVPDVVRNDFIHTYRTMPNNIGRCPELTKYVSWANTIVADKAANPTLSWRDTYRLVVEPKVINAEGNLTSIPVQTTLANAACQTAVDTVYGAAVHSAKYVLYSGNKCSVL
jgi:type II secretory pathway pseudopilin PulG